MVPGTSQPLLESVERETLRIGRLAADLRKLADVEVGVLEQAQVDLANLLHEVVAAVEEQPEVADRALRLVLPAAPWPLPAVQGDPDLFFLAVHNLVVNALKFSTVATRLRCAPTSKGAKCLLRWRILAVAFPTMKRPTFGMNFIEDRARGVHQGVV